MEPNAPEQPPVLSQREASTIAREVRNLIKAGEEAIAWERLSSLHPADMGAILASLPRSSRDTIMGIVDPETLTWMFRQMNPLEAGKVAAPAGFPADYRGIESGQPSKRHADPAQIAAAPGPGSVGESGAGGCGKRGFPVRARHRRGADGSRISRRPPG